MEWNPARLAHPWFARVADLVARFADAPSWPSIARLNDCFAAELGDLRLVESAKTKPALAGGVIDPASLYEVRIADHGEIPTRPNNAHDLLNTLVWAAFPRSKLALSRALAALQRARIAGRSTLPNTRTREHDRLALVDEGALLVVNGETWIFGHAIYEHAYAGDFTVRGAPVDLDLDVPGLADRAAIDRVFAAADLARVVRGGPGIPVG